MSDNRPLGEASATPASTGDSHQAKAEADQLMFDPNGPYWDSGHRQHKQTVERVTKLLGQVHGDTPAIAEDGSSNYFDESIEKALEPPEDPADYKFKDVIELGEGQDWDSDLAEEAAHWASMGDLPIEEAQGFARRYQELATLDAEGIASLRDSTEEGLQKQWGDNYARNMTACKSVVASIGSEFQEFLNTSRLGDDYNMALTLYRVAQEKGLVQ